MPDFPDHLTSLQPVYVGPPQVRGSSKRTCVDCGTLVWISPATLDLAMKHFATIVCWDCAHKRTRDDNVHVVPSPGFVQRASARVGVSPEVIRELARLSSTEPDDK